MRVREFLKANNLKQRELASFLGVTEAAISNVVKGKSEFAKENLIKIFKNPHGWDVSMLKKEQSESLVEDKQTASSSLIEYLQRKVAELEKENAELLQENAVLRYENRMLTPRKGDVEDADISLSASAI